MSHIKVNYVFSMFPSRHRGSKALTGELIYLTGEKKKEFRKPFQKKEIRKFN